MPPQKAVPTTLNARGQRGPCHHSVKNGSWFLAVPDAIAGDREVLVLAKGHRVAGAITKSDDGMIASDPGFLTPLVLVPDATGLDSNKLGLGEQAHAGAPELIIHPASGNCFHVHA